VPFDPEYEVLADKWNSRLLEKFPFLEARVGMAALPMDVREEQVRSSETSWGNFIVDQMRVAFGEPMADLAFINSGTLRIDDYIEGDIRFEDIGRTFGFSSFLRYTTVTGAEFKRIMEAGYRGGPESQGYFPPGFAYVSIAAATNSIASSACRYRSTAAGRRSRRIVSTRWSFRIFSTAVATGMRSPRIVSRHVRARS
jgi:2',3'-cyclic-nucleotide 2'-phosphodiesterase (5'-nucleotidase family)